MMDELQRLRAEYNQALSEYQKANTFMLELAGGDSSAEEFRQASAKISRAAETLRVRRAALSACLRRHQDELAQRVSSGRGYRA